MNAKKSYRKAWGKTSIDSARRGAHDIKSKDTDPSILVFPPD
jgi:hypothetical protein